MIGPHGIPVQVYNYENVNEFIIGDNDSIPEDNEGLDRNLGQDLPCDCDICIEEKNNPALK